MQGTELVVMAALCFTSGGFHISMKIHIPPLRERVFWCVAKV